MMKLITKVKNFLIFIFFYPLFILTYTLYSVLYQFTCLVQHLFTEIYIEQVCGFKDKEKIIEAINSLQKVPQDVIMALSVDKFIVESDEQNKQIENKIVQQYLQVLIKIQAIKNITLFLNSESTKLDKIISQIKTKLESLQSQKKILVIDRKKRLVQSVEKLEQNKLKTPFLIVFSSYASACDIPSKYLVNAEIAFNTDIFSSSNYDIYKSFCQYSSSKQRNGK